ncbi:MAG: hypothetical protein RTU63_08270 [Candidatus Thorarchaeota archaeon]
MVSTKDTGMGRYEYLLVIGILGLLISFATIPLLFGTGFEGWNEWYSFWYNSYLFSFTFYSPVGILTSGPIIMCTSLFLALGSLFFLVKHRNPVALVSTGAFIASFYYNFQWTYYFYNTPNSTTFPDPVTWLSWWGMLDLGFLVFTFSYLMLSCVLLISSICVLREFRFRLVSLLSVGLSAAAFYLQFIDTVPTWQPSSVVRSGSLIHLGLLPLLISSVVFLIALFLVRSSFSSTKRIDTLVR